MTPAIQSFPPRGMIPTFRCIAIMQHEKVNGGFCSILQTLFLARVLHACPSVNLLLCHNRPLSSSIGVCLEINEDPISYPAEFMGESRVRTRRAKLPWAALRVKYRQPCFISRIETPRCDASKLSRELQA